MPEKPSKQPTLKQIQAMGLSNAIAATKEQPPTRRDDNYAMRAGFRYLRDQIQCRIQQWLLLMRGGGYQSSENFVADVLDLLFELQAIDLHGIAELVRSANFEERAIKRLRRLYRQRPSGRKSLAPRR